jgi:hypothetical protein
MSFSIDDIQSFAVAGGIGVVVGFCTKALLDSGTRNKSSSGLLNILNGLTFNVFSKIAEKTGTTENNVIAAVSVIAITALAFWGIKSYKPDPRNEEEQRLLPSTTSVTQHTPHGTSVSATGGGAAASHGSAAATGRGVAISGHGARIFQTIHSPDGREDVRIHLYSLGYKNAQLTIYLRILALPDSPDTELARSMTLSVLEDALPTYRDSFRALDVSPPSADEEITEDTLLTHMRRLRTRYPAEYPYAILGMAGGLFAGTAEVIPTATEYAIAALNELGINRTPEEILAATAGAEGESMIRRRLFALATPEDASPQP